MFTKVFRTIYDGTLAENWRAMVTFQQLLILADEQGVVDMTPSAISRTTGIPLDIITDGLAVLEAPDPMSRTADMEGRRIARLDVHRPWGWFLVNFRKYNELKNRDEKREADRIRIAAKRESARQAATKSDMSQGVAGCSEVSQDVANVAHTDPDPDVNPKAKSKEEEREKPTAPPAPSARRSAVELQTWIDSLPADEQPIPGDDPIIDYAEKVGIPYDYLLLAWEEFRERMAGKRQKDWRAHYRNAVRANWFKLWWMRDGGECALTTQGEQAKRRHGL